jgi:hypothetical protein
MHFFKEFSELTELRKCHLMSMIFGRILNIAIFTVTTFIIVKYFGAKGMIIKDQLIAISSLALFIGSFASMAGKNPVKFLKFIFLLEIISLIGFLIAGMDIYSIYILPLSTATLTITNLMMQSLIKQVDSIVTSGDSTFCDYYIKFSAISGFTGAAIGLTIGFYEISVFPVFLLALVMLLGCRYFRFKTYFIIFGHDNKISANDLSTQLKTSKA